MTQSNGQSNGWRIGRAAITAIHETDAGGIIQSGIPEAAPERLLEFPWLRPHFTDNAGRMKAVVQSFLIELGGATILVDTCVGNGKARPGLTAWSGLQTDFLQRLSTRGVETRDVDFVICTHLHFDHVGWNTVPGNGKWVPTFERARHILCRKEFEYWNTWPAAETPDDRAGFEDSVLPVLDAGLVDLVEADHEVRPGIRLLATHGHTPGHVSVLVESEGERAIITGDALHHPSQIAHPEWGISSDFNPAHAHRTRRDLLEHCAETETLLIGSHFAPPAAVTVHREGSSFRAE